MNLVEFLHFSTTNKVNTLENVYELYIRLREVSFKMSYPWYLSEGEIVRGTCKLFAGCFVFLLCRNVWMETVEEECGQVWAGLDRVFRGKNLCQRLSAPGRVQTCLSGDSSVPSYRPVYYGTIHLLFIIWLWEAFLFREWTLSHGENKFWNDSTSVHFSHTFFK